MQRLDAILSHNGFGTRREVKSLIRSGAVSINGTICVHSEFHVDAQKDSIEVQGKSIVHREHIYLMMYKPSGVVSAAKDDIHQTVMDILPDTYKTQRLQQDLHLIGRLDIDTEGLLILTTDGELTHRLTSPKSNIDKTYFIRLRDPISCEKDFRQLQNQFLSGILLNDFYTDYTDYRCLPAKLELSALFNSTAAVFPITDVLLSIHEGKYHQIKRMCLAIKNAVVYLKRLTMGPILLDDTIEKGAVRELTKEEIESLQQGKVEK